MDDMNKAKQEHIDLQRLNHPETVEENNSSDEKWDYMDDHVPLIYEGDCRDLDDDDDDDDLTIHSSHKFRSNGDILADDYYDPLDAYWGVEDIGDALAAADIYVDDFAYEPPRKKFVLTEEQLQRRKFYEYVEGENPENYIPTEEALEWRAKFIADPNFIPF